MGGGGGHRTEELEEEGPTCEAIGWRAHSRRLISSVVVRIGGRWPPEVWRALFPDRPRILRAHLLSSNSVVLTGSSAAHSAVYADVSATPRREQVDRGLHRTPPPYCHQCILSPPSTCGVSATLGAGGGGLMQGSPQVRQLCPVRGCGKLLDRCSGRPRALPPDFSLQLDSSIDAVVNDRMCQGCYERHTGAIRSLDGRVRKLTTTSSAAPHLDELAAVAIGQPVEPSSPPPSPSPLPSQPPPPSPSPSSSVSLTPLLSTSPHSSLPLPALSSLPAARRALALSQTTLHDINPAGPPCPTASTPDHAHHIISGPRSSLLSSHHPQPQHEARTSDASGSDALRLYFGCRPVVPRLYRGCGWLYPTTCWL